MKIVDATVLFEDDLSMHGIKKVEIKLLEHFSRDPSISFVNLLSPISPAYVSREQVIKLLTNPDNESPIKEQVLHGENEKSVKRKNWLSLMKSFLVRKLRGFLSKTPKTLRLFITVPLGLSLFIYRGLRRIWNAVTSTVGDFLDFVNREKATSDSVSEPQIPNAEGYVSIIPLKELGNLGVLADLRAEDSFFSAGLLWKRLDLDSFTRQKRLKGFRFYSILYDIIPLKFPHFGFAPELGSYRKYFSFLAQVSDTLFTYSETNILDIQEYASNNLFLDETKIERVNLGFDDFWNAHDLLDPIDWLSGRKFIIFVSTVERRKNHEVLYRAYKLAVETGIADQLPTLLFVGGPGWGSENMINDVLRDPALVDSSGRRLIVLLGTVTQENLNWLYKYSHFSVYPSLYEGWGLPITESILMETQVLASDVSSLRESGFGIASHIAPNDHSAWLDAIVSFSTKPKAEVSLSLELPTWGDMASSIVSLMETKMGAP